MIARIISLRTLAAIAVWAGLCLSAAAGSFTATLIDTSGDGYALFNANSRHVARNARGIFISYQIGSNEPSYNANQQKVVWFREAPEASEPTTLWSETIASNAPCIAGQSEGGLWAAWGDPFANIAHVLHWLDPAVSTAPLSYSFAMDQAGNSKFTCAWDESRRAFFFISTASSVLRLNEDGTLNLLSPSIFTVTSNRAPEYPSFYIEPQQGNMILSWITVDTTSSSPQYRFIGALESRGASGYWSSSGIPPWTVKPADGLGSPLTIAPDENGPSIRVTYRSEELSSNNFLVAVTADPAAMHFAFFRTPNAGERCLATLPRCTLTYYAYPRGSPLSPPPAIDGARPLRGETIFPHGAVGGTFAWLGSTLYFVTAYQGKLAALRKGTDGIWHDAGTLPLTDFDPTSQCLNNVSAERGWRGDADIVGVLSIISKSCSSWASAPGSNLVSTQIIFWRFTP